MKTPETKYTAKPGTLDEPNRLHGFAARYDEESQILFDKNVCKVPFVEVIKPGAFTRTLRENDDIRALNSHDKSEVLGRTKAGTLKLTDLEEGLYFDNLMPDTSFARDLRVSMTRGDIDGCSFYGYVMQDEIEMRPGRPALRTIREISLIEITPATAFPAYHSATAAIRSQYPELFQEPAVDEGVMVALFVPAEVASLLAIPGGEPADRLHVTLAYLGRLSEVGSDRIDQLKALLTDLARCSAPLAGTIGRTGRFPASISSDGMGVMVALVDVPGLVELRQSICVGMEASGFSYKKDHGFTPHVTLDYLEPRTPMGEVLESRAVRFDAFTLAIGEGRQHFPLGPDRQPAPDQGGYPLNLARARLWLASAE